MPEEQEMGLEELIDMIVFQELGFDFAHKTDIVEKMEKITCDGSTAMRDAFYCGCQSFLKLSNRLKQEGILG